VLVDVVLVRNDLVKRIQRGVRAYPPPIRIDAKDGTEKARLIRR
jgi:hypothetical protein